MRRERGLIEVRAQSLLREALDGRVEVDEPERDAELRTDRQACRVARCPDLGALGVGQVERVLEHVVRVEPDLLRLVDALDATDVRPQPRGADHAQLERSSHLASLPEVAHTMLCIPTRSDTVFAFARASRAGEIEGVLRDRIARRPPGAPPATGATVAVPGSACTPCALGRRPAGLR